MRRSRLALSPHINGVLLGIGNAVFDPSVHLRLKLADYQSARTSKRQHERLALRVCHAATRAGSTPAGCTASESGDEAYERACVIKL